MFSSIQLLATIIHTSELQDLQSISMIIYKDLTVGSTDMMDDSITTTQTLEEQKLSQITVSLRLLLIERQEP